MTAVSSTEGKKEIKEWFDKQTDIISIVDVGCGSGTYVKLLGWEKYHWIGIEIFRPYVHKYNLWSFYDELHVGSFFEFFDKVTADCIIFGDVLEHMTKEDAIRAINMADQKFKHVVISIPLNYEQGEVDGNPYEAHLSIWNMEELNGIIPPSFIVRGTSWDIAIFIK